MFDLGSSRGGEGGSPDPLPLRLSEFHPGGDPLASDVVLELGEHGHHAEQGFARGGSGVNVLGIGDEFDAERPEFFEAVQQLPGRTGEPVELPDQHRVGAPLSHVV